MQREQYRLGDILVDIAQRKLTRADQDVSVEPKTFAVIAHLIRHAGNLVTRNELLDAVWGHRFVTPSTLNRTITLARRAFGDDAGTPRYIVTVHGAGYRIVGPVDRVESPDTRDPVRFAPPLICRLPARIDPLIGREAELSDIAELLVNHRAVTVLGPGGIGKTQCALELARRRSSDFPDGIWFFDLSPMSAGRDWFLSLAASLAIATDDEDSRVLNRVLGLLQTRCALLLLDNCDRIAGEVGHWVHQILSGTDRIRILATSQALLNFRGERVIRLPPLDLPEERAVEASDVDRVARSPAVAMLLTRVNSVQPGFQLSRANMRYIVDICRRLEGLPLALELAGARFALLSPEQIAGRLEHRFQFLRGTSSGRDRRHESLAAMLEWSLGLLSPEELRLLCWFSVFVNGWTMDAAIEVCATLGFDAQGAVELLTGLVDKSLVVTEPGLTPPRYRMLDMVRERAVGHLQDQDEERARLAHLRSVVRMCEAARVDMVSGSMQQRIEQLIREHGNIDAAVAYASNHGQRRDDALRIIGSLTLYTKAHGAIDEALRWGQRSLGGTESLDSVERGRALLTLGVALVHRAGEPSVVAATLAEAARIAHRNRDAWTEGYAYGYRSLWLSHCGAPDMAEIDATITEGIAEAINDPLLQGLSGLARGWIHLARGNFDRAIGVLQGVRVLGQDLHQRHFIDIYIALALLSQGKICAAALQFRESLLLAAEVLNYRGMAGSIEGCGYLCATLGFFADAVRYLEVARRIRERTHVPLFSFWLPHHRAAEVLLRQSLTDAEYSTQRLAGGAMREEDAANEVLERLQAFATVDEKKPLGS